MMDFVLDSSVALAWCFPDEASPGTLEILRRLDHEEAVVPFLWHLEIANILSLAVRKGRITKPHMKEYLRLLATYPILTDEETAARALTDTLVLSVDHALTAYDAAYLELARRFRIPLASKDKALCAAARKLKIGLIEA